MRLRAAVFDFGETLLSEERAWGVWADWIGVTRQELFAALGATVEGRHPHRHALELCRPGFDLARAFAEREAAGVPRHEELYDVYRTPPARWRGCARRACGSGSPATSPPARRPRSPSLSPTATSSRRPPTGASRSPTRPSSPHRRRARAHGGRDRLHRRPRRQRHPPRRRGRPVHRPPPPRPLGNHPGRLAGGETGGTSPRPNLDEAAAAILGRDARWPLPPPTRRERPSRGACAAGAGRGRGAGGGGVSRGGCLGGRAPGRSRREPRRRVPPWPERASGGGRLGGRSGLCRCRGRGGCRRPGRAPERSRWVPGRGGCPAAGAGAGAVSAGAGAGAGASAAGAGAGAVSAGAGAGAGARRPEWGPGVGGGGPRWRARVPRRPEPGRRLGGRSGVGSRRAPRRPEPSRRAPPRLGPGRRRRRGGLGRRRGGRVRPEPRQRPSARRPAGRRARGRRRRGRPGRSSSGRGRGRARGGRGREGGVAFGVDVDALTLVVVAVWWSCPRSAWSLRGTGPGWWPCRSRGPRSGGAGRCRSRCSRPCRSRRRRGRRSPWWC